MSQGTFVVFRIREYRGGEGEGDEDEDEDEEEEDEDEDEGGRFGEQRALVVLGDLL